MRKLLSLAALFGLSIVTANASLAAPTCGDVYKDGKIDHKDKVLVNRYYHHVKYKMKMRHKVDPNIADVNLDGKVDKKDVKLVEKMGSGEVTCLPCPANKNACKAKENPSQDNGRSGYLPGFL